ncbi:hypothetical protein FEM48_Zijuj11G0105700 [Ziziphus jujuba var. spinosa]|uniref:Uncharacterized protein n=1 Tax=Ziziphus jujuba var. spinosa TaxID=714518 RepID=A0A978UIG0_ZIZJJ|nr:hypothetical protein FEM48_Zijuj11G0105700 [Ziziphus jujuba var. spinosa]
MAEEDVYTKDGTTDFCNKPAIKKKTGTWKACPYILGNECCERLAYYGINTNLVNYLKYQLNQRNVVAVNNVTNWSGTCYVTPLLGAFLADAYLGRYWTIAVFSIIYVFKPGGSPITRIFQVMVASFRKFRVQLPNDKSLLYEISDEESAVKGSRKLDHTEQLSFLDKAAVETKPDRIKGTVNPWRLCTVTQVEELKSIIRLLPIWATGIIFSAVYSQMGTLFVLQGNTMDLHITQSFQIPSASLSLFDTLSVIFWVPIYDRVIVPLARKLTGHKNGFTQLQRIAIGLAISILAMLCSGTLTSNFN